MRWGSSWILAQLKLEPLLLLLSNEMRLKLSIGSARASIIITFQWDEARAEYWLSSSLYYYYFPMRWGSSWILAQLEPLLLLLSNEIRLELNIGSAQARASFIISLKLERLILRYPPKYTLKPITPVIWCTQGCKSISFNEYGSNHCGYQK